MTVNRVVMPYPGTEIGGSHISSFTLGQALQRDHGIEVVVYARDESLVAQEARRRGLTVRPLDEPAAVRHNPLYELKRLLPRIATLRAEGPGTMLHSNDIGSLQAWGPAARWLGLPTVYSNRAFNRPIIANRMVWEFADTIVCVSHSIRNHIDPRSRKRAVVIDNPFELGACPEREVARAALAADLDLSPTDRIVGYAANFWERKRPVYFLDACRLIGEHYPDARFVVFGRDGDVKIEALRAHALSIGIADRTRFAGFRLPGEANIAAMDVHLIPALQEPFGRTPIESLLLGTPYVAMDDAGNSEIGARFGGGCMLPPDASVEAFAAAAIDVLADPDGTRLNDRRRAEVKVQLSADTHVARMMEVYTALDRGKGGR